MSGRKGTKTVTEKDFKVAKALVGAGLSTSKIADVMGRSYSTAMYLANSNSFQEYRDKITAMGRARKVVQPQVMSPQALVMPESSNPGYIKSLTEPENQRDVIELLNSIDNHLEFIAENMVVRHKRKIFGGPQ